MRLIFLTLMPLLILDCSPNPGERAASTSDLSDWPLLNFVKVDSLNPILRPSPDLTFSCPVSKEDVNWEERNVLNPSALVRDGKVYMIYRAQDEGMTSRLGLAISEDGLHFEKQAAPIFYPANDSMLHYEWKGGVEDPRIVEGEDETYIMTYTSYDGKTARLDTHHALFP